MFLDILGTGTGPSYERFGHSTNPMLRSNEGLLGRGFSLTVTKVVFERHGGSLKFSQSESGGHLTVRLPKAASSSKKQDPTFYD